MQFNTITFEESGLPDHPFLRVIFSEKIKQIEKILREFPNATDELYQAYDCAQEDIIKEVYKDTVLKKYELMMSADDVEIEFPTTAAYLASGWNLRVDRAPLFESLPKNIRERVLVLNQTLNDLKVNTALDSFDVTFRPDMNALYDDPQIASVTQAQIIIGLESKFYQSIFNNEAKRALHFDYIVDYIEQYDLNTVGSSVLAERIQQRAPRGYDVEQSPDRKPEVNSL